MGPILPDPGYTLCPKCGSKTASLPDLPVRCNRCGGTRRQVLLCKKCLQPVPLSSDPNKAPICPRCGEDVVAQFRSATERQHRMAQIIGLVLLVALVAGAALLARRFWFHPGP
ncbi:MAG TPA: hypothetical protein VKW04_13125 [Planctomycetota bacterium]|nr:hypothetical protein [Planctomycetota bacterium]